MSHKDLIEEVVKNEISPILRNAIGYYVTLSKEESSSLEDCINEELPQLLTTLVSKVEERAYRLAHYAEHSPSCFLFNNEAGEDGIENCDCGLREALQPKVTNKSHQEKEVEQLHQPEVTNKKV